MSEPLREPGAGNILQSPDSIDDVTADVAFGSTRTPNGTRPTLVTVSVSVEATGGSEGRVECDIDGSPTAFVAVNTAAGALSGNPDVSQTETVTFLVPAGSTYTIRNALDPAATNAIDAVHEAQL